MTKRFFYTDALAAAWMARHHGMKILGPVLEAATGKRITSGRPMPVWILARAIEAAEKGLCGEDDKYFVHPDSLQLLLSPQVGDILRLYFYSPAEDDKHGAVMTGFYAGAGEAITWFRDPKDGCINKELHKIDEHQWRIIQRAGIAFHHPENEDV